MKIVHAVQIVATSEIHKLGQKKLGTLLTPRELAYCAWHKRRSPEHAAARLAAKRALKKILPGAEWLEIQIHKEESGKPYFEFTGKTAALVKKLKTGPLNLSLSHTEEEAVASLLAI